MFGGYNAGNDFCSVFTAYSPDEFPQADGNWSREYCIAMLRYPYSGTHEDTTYSHIKCVF